MDSTGDGRNSIGVVLVADPELAAKGPEGGGHDSWTFNFSNLSCAVEVADKGDKPVPVHRPHAAAKFTRYEHVVPKCAHLVEGNPGMVRRAAAVWDGRKHYGRIGWPQLPDVGASGDKIVARGEPGIGGLGWSDSHV